MRAKIIPPEVITQLLSVEFITRFWSNVSIRTIDECWPWKRYIGKSGYGMLHANVDGFKPMGFLVHRIAWIITHKKDVPDGLFILRSCIGNRRCCNPKHLNPGTQSKNLQDAFDQKRRVILRGQDHLAAKLTETQAVQIKNLYSEGHVTQRSIADKFGIGQQQVSRIINGIRWAHLS